MNPISKLLIAAMRSHLKRTGHYANVRKGGNFVECLKCKRYVHVVDNRLWLRVPPGQEPRQITPEEF